MKRQWFTLAEIQQKQKACPVSIGQAEAGRFTFCIGEQCMAWTWMDREIEQGSDNIKEVYADSIPDGWEPICEPYKENEEEDLLVKVMKKPTHGRCGMVP